MDERLANLKGYVEECVIKHAEADIVLASGRKSDFYFDGRRVTLSSEALALLGEVVLEEMDAVKATAVGGPTLGADPIIGGTLAVAGAKGRKIKGFIIRKERKARGMMKLVEGPELAPGERVILVEDTVTTGGSVLRAAGSLKEEYPEVEVAEVLTIVDRLEGGREAIEGAGFRFKALFTREDFREG